MTLETTQLPAPVMTTATVIATTDGLTSGPVPAVRLLIDPATVAEEEDTTGADVMLKVLVVLSRASRLHLSSTVPKLLSKYGMIPPSGDLLWRKPKMCPKTLLNLIKVLRLSAWLRIPRICI